MGKPRPCVCGTCRFCLDVAASPALRAKYAPGSITKAVNFTKAVVQHVAAGVPTLDPAMQRRRIKTCEACPHFNRSRGCDLCGCSMDTKSWWSEQKCPQGKWEVPIILVDMSSGPQDQIGVQGLGDILLALSAVAGLQDAHPGKEVWIRCQGRWLPWVRLFKEGQYSLGLHEKLPYEPITTYRPYATAIAKENRERSAKARCDYFAAECETTAQRPSFLPIPAHAMGGVESYRDCILLIPHAHWKTRLWTVAGWQELREKLKALGKRPVILCEVGGAGIAKEIGGEAIINAPADGAEKIAALMSVAGAVVGIDTGTVHLAGALQRPTIVLSGPTRGDRIFGIYETVHSIQGPLHCTGCYWQAPFSHECDKGCAALGNITPEMIVLELEAMGILRKSVESIQEPKKKVTVEFRHGLGDCVNFALQIPLYLRRGFEIEVNGYPDKEVLFRAAGATVVPGGGSYHSWPHPHNHGKVAPVGAWSGNKSALSLSHHPMPNIGSISALWPEYIASKIDLDSLLSREAQLSVEGFVKILPYPLILFHPQGNTGPDRKNLTHQQQEELLRGLLDRTNGSIIILDWDNRVFKIHNGRVRHLRDDWKLLNLEELYALMKVANLFIGVDSGPLHFSRLANLPAIGLWKTYPPNGFVLPRRSALHLAPSEQNEWTRHHRADYQIVEYDGPGSLATVAVEQAARMLCERLYLKESASDCFLRHLIDNLKQPAKGSPLTTWYDRHRSFDAFLRKIAKKTAPVIVETGCMRGEEDWTAGMSTFLLGLFVEHHGGSLASVDDDARHCEFARQWTRWFSSVQVMQSDSREFFKGYTGEKIDALYLDSADTGTPGFQECCLAEAQLSLPCLTIDAVVLIDDTCWGSGEIHGKGATAVPWLLQNGFEVRYAGYQVLLQRKPGVSVS
jgi:ADP-heptose:LPS heptosyltransferase